jgi:hypothetical protein
MKRVRKFVSAKKRGSLPPSIGPYPAMISRSGTGKNGGNPVSFAPKPLQFLVKDDILFLL